MKIAVSTEAGNVAAHFGRCPSYTLYEIKDGQIIQKEEIENPGHRPGFLPKFLSEKGVDVVITGGMGPRAQNLFQQYNIQSLTGIQGPVSDVIGTYLRGELKPGEDLCDHAHGEGHECRENQPLHPPSRTSNQISAIGLTASGPSLESEIEPNFGRAPYFLIYKPESSQLDSFENPNRDTAQGAGIQSARFFADHKIDVLLTGRVGPNAEKVLQSAGISIITGVKGNAGDAVNSIVKG